MDSVPNIAVEIARQVAPDEIFEAPLIAENFVKGGKSRKELLQQTRAGGCACIISTESALCCTETVAAVCRHDDKGATKGGLIAGGERESCI